MSVSTDKNSYAHCKIKNKKVEMKRAITLCFLCLITTNSFAFPMFTEAAATGTTIKFTTKLSEKLPSGYKVKIDYGNGKGLVPMTCSGLACSLSTNKLLSGLNSSNYEIGIYNANGVLQGKKIGWFYVISSPAIFFTSSNDEFCAGFEEGYKAIKGDVVIVPICPLHSTPLGITDFRYGLRSGIRRATQ
jgi:hypothetical protein